MKNLVFEFKKGILSVWYEDAGLYEKREVKDIKKFDEWIKGYQEALKESDNSELLLEIGQSIYKWLDGPENWLKKGINAFSNKELSVIFVVPDKPTDDELSFLEIPWELLADDNQHFATNKNFFYNPVRQIGQKQNKPNPSDHHSVSALFMSASPVLHKSLTINYEEEESSILNATMKIGVDLHIEESGTLELLAQTMALHKPVDILHIACNGTNRPVPSLILETNEGEKALVSAKKLSESISENIPKLLFLSTYVRSKPYRFFNSFCYRIIEQGFPSVIGWPGSLNHVEAREFASEIYRNLSQNNTLESSVLNARQVLLSQNNGSKDWHLPRLYLGPTGGGSLFVQENVRKHKSAEFTRKTFLDTKSKQIPVPGKNEFVGRRRQVQSIIKEFRIFNRAGVAIQGHIGQGKSSLVARIASFMPDHQVVVVYRKYDALTILEAFAKSISTPSLLAMVDRHRERVRRDASKLTVALNEILSGPCKDAIKDKNGNINSCPALVVIDDFERALESDSNDKHSVSPEFKQAIMFVIESFKNAATSSRLLFTSRYSFTLPSQNQVHDIAKDLYWVNLPPMQEYEGQKMVASRIKVAKKNVDLERSLRCIKVARGNPGLLNLIFAMSIQEPEKCDIALRAMETCIRTSNISDNEKLLEFLESLAIRNIMSLLTHDEKELISAGTLFNIPVPIETFELIAKNIGKTSGVSLCERLLGLGLLESFDDPINKNNMAVSVNSLISLQVVNLTPDQRKIMARLIIKDLFNRWTGMQGEQHKSIVDFELTKLAVEATEPSCISINAVNAARWLKNRFLYKDAANLCKRCLTILDNAEVTALPDLLTVAGELCRQTGDMESAGSYLSKAMEIYKNIDEKPETFEGFHYAETLISYGCFFIQERKPDQALSLLKRVESYLKGDKTNFEPVINIYKEKSDESSNLFREICITIENIALIMNEKGEVYEALKLNNERLNIYDEVKDIEAKAKVLWDTAKIEIKTGLLHDAYKHLEKSYSIYMEILNRFPIHLESACRVGVLLGYMLCAADRKKEGLKILEFSKQGFEKLGQNELYERTKAMIRVFS